MAIEEERPRFESVDAFRGIAVAAMLLVNDPGDWAHIYAPLRHAPWDGCTPADLVFPFFLFTVGVSIALARERLTHAAVVTRALRIVGLGLVLHALAYLLLDRPEYRIPGVLQRVGLCYGAAALLALHARRDAQWIAFAAILLGYWAWTGWGEPYTLDNRPDPEGLTSTLPAIATTILGLRAGEWLQRGKPAAHLRSPAWRRCCWARSGRTSSQFNKTLWTSSYVLWSGGWALLALALLDAAIDLERWPALGRRMGRNAIAIYSGAWLMAVLLDAWRWREAAFASLASLLPSPEMASLAYAIAFTTLWWIVAVVLDRRAIYLRI